MSVEREDRRASIARALVSVPLLAGVALAGTVMLPPLIIGGLLLAVSVFYLSRRAVLRWDVGLIVFTLIIMFIPIRRFALPIPLPFALEPYRVALLILLGAVILALLTEPTFVWRPVRFGWQIGIFIATLTASISFNGTDLVESALASTALGALVNMLIMLSVFFIVRQLLDSESQVMLLLQMLVSAGGIVGFFAVVERFTRVNIFLRINRIIPLDSLTEESTAYRAGGNRSYASAQHPIALSVMMCMLIPLAIYLMKYSPWPRKVLNRRVVYGMAAFWMVAGIAMAVSRTAMVTIGVVMIVVMIFRPFLGISLSILALPLLALGALTVPKVFNELIGSFFDFNGLIASQYTSAGSAGAGRLADLDPAMKLVAAHPYFGTGVGGRIVVGPERNSFILDNQVLGSLLDTGIVGVVGLFALTVAPIFAVMRFSFKRDVDPRHSDLAFALAASLVANVAALYFYDAFGFLQTFFIFCMVLAISAWLLTEGHLSKGPARETVSAKHRAYT
ncbi:hypothetical protein BH09ACT10_BH09ACT10_21770 [soil metagenome]